MESKYTEADEVRKSFQVEIERVKKHVFVIDDVNSSEEAEQVAEELLLEGEEGAVVDIENINIDSFVINPKEDIN